MLALEYAIDHPVRSLVLVCSGTFDLTARAAFLRDRDNPYVLDPLPPDPLDESTLDMRANRETWEDELRLQAEGRHPRRSRRSRRRVDGSWHRRSAPRPDDPRLAADPAARLSRARRLLALPVARARRPRAIRGARPRVPTRLGTCGPHRRAPGASMQSRARAASPAPPCGRGGSTRRARRPRP